MVGSSDRFTFPPRIATISEYHGTSLSPAMDIRRVDWSIKDVPSIMSTATFGAISDQIWVFMSSRRRLRRMSLSHESGCFVAVWSVRSLFQFIVFPKSSGIPEEPVRQ